MRTNLSGILTLLLAFVVHITFAQEKTISGMVTDQSGLPLPGVNIVVVGTTNGTQTDFDGNYSIKASEGQTLMFTYIGQKEVRRTIGADNSINVQMEEDAQALDEVVVTAVGITRSEKGLGYNVQSVEAEAISVKPNADLVNSLNGATSGVQIVNASGEAGASTLYYH
ncbi:carboxypeptidase-like regulatory domain-containing protein [Maribacter arenosus]|uniref:Carboxypeptidase-like regulatory domain-containing protein n=1 Tax=Maribacter arenosus TaxID=1854708 RepID=A0ABR7VAI9_9FLAO|nr:carboxypeptidase-like regulatory domain-containing protein [Maribacter arenosus]MBD0850673.1 carboxypeptidase-like regulatory domain-containing protein [Maribacter arenosus]